MLYSLDISPIAFSIASIDVYWYGISYAASFLIAWQLLILLARRPNSRVTPQAVSDVVFYSAVGVVFGGRLGSLLFYHLEHFFQNPLIFFNFKDGGMSFHGGMLGVGVALYFFAKKLDIKFFLLSDFIIPVVPVGLFFGRIANFINGELWGKPTSLPWAVVFPHSYAGGVGRHPSQLYEAALEGGLLFVVLWLYVSKPRPMGTATALFIFGYGVIRFLIEFVREPDSHIGYIAFGWLTIGQCLTIPMILGGAVLFWLSSRMKRE